MFNLKGEKVNSVYNGHLEAGKKDFKDVDISSLQSGLYLLKVIEGNKVSVHKFSVK
jgi:hypothetical protein